MLSPEVVARFWRDVPDTPDGCWRWTGSHSGQGYGQFVFRGQKYLAHRVAVEIDGRSIPKGLVVDHMCRVRDCVNPAHLRVVTQKVNSLENSNSFAAFFAARTHCVHGHEYTPENTRIKHHRNATERVCRACHRANADAHRVKNGRPPCQPGTPERRREIAIYMNQVRWGHSLTKDSTSAPPIF